LMLALETRGSGFQPPVSIPASTTTNKLLQLGNFRASNIELPVSAVRHPVEIPASTPTNKLLQLGNFTPASHKQGSL